MFLLDDTLPISAYNECVAVRGYHISCDSELKINLDCRGIHIGSLNQAISRAYLHVVENEIEQVYLYSVDVDLTDLRITHINDTRENVGEEELYLKAIADVAFYHNKCEGAHNYASNPCNVSCVVLNTKLIPCKAHKDSTWDYNSILKYSNKFLGY